MGAAVDDGAAEEGRGGAGEDEADDEGGDGDGVGVVECFDPGCERSGRVGRGTTQRRRKRVAINNFSTPHRRLVASLLAALQDSPAPLNPRIILLANQIPQVDHKIIHLDIRQVPAALLPMLVPYLSPLPVMRTPSWRAEAVVKV